MPLKALHQTYKEHQLSGRYISYQHIESLLENYATIFEKKVLGTSVLGVPICCLKIGQGEKKVLAWSQMHGNESTTTKAVFDLLRYLSFYQDVPDGVLTFFEKFTLYVIPMLNPDGAAAFTRVNANSIDINRDAQALSQPESKLLRQLFNELQPHLCLNMHDQRSIFGLENGNPAVVSFLAPAGDEARTLLPARKEAMRLIEKMNTSLQSLLPNSIGRYDDSFNPNCVGDAFTMEGVPTILFEAGHTGQDYDREQTRSFIFYALLSLFDLISTSPTMMSYTDIPENQKNYCDVVLHNVYLKMNPDVKEVAIQFQEVLENGMLIFKPTIFELKTSLLGYREIDCKGAEINFDGLTEIQKGKVFDKVYISSNKRMILLNIS